LTREQHGPSAHPQDSNRTDSQKRQNKGFEKQHFIAVQRARPSTGAVQKLNYFAAAASFCGEPFDSPAPLQWTAFYADSTAPLFPPHPR
jgi:hypothetical protein